ncbi:MAG: Sec-independent protein translocase protein TatB [Pseudomonadota bacterium]
MFDFSLNEVFVIAVVMLIVMGPQRLPEVLRTAGLWLGRLRRSFNSVKTEIESEIGMDEIRRQLHNEAVMEEMRRIEAEVNGTVDHSSATDRTQADDHIADATGHATPADSASTDPSTAAADAPTEPAPEPEPETSPRPRSEAELEALHARARQASKRT